MKSNKDKIYHAVPISSQPGVILTWQFLED